MRISIVIGAILIFSSAQAASLDTNTTRFFEFLYNYKFKSADNLLGEMKASGYSKNLLSVLQVNYSWHLILSGNSNPLAIVNCIRETEQEIENQLATYEENSSSDNYNLVVLYGYIARLSILQGNKLSGVNAFFSGIKYLEKLDTCETADKDIFNLAGGIYFSLIGYAYETHPYLFVFNNYARYANKQKGFELLLQGTNSNIYYIRVESLYFLAKMCAELDKNPKSSITYNDQLLKLAPGNLLFLYYHIRLLKSIGKTEQVSEEMILLKNLADQNCELTDFQKEYFINELQKELE